MFLASMLMTAILILHLNRSTRPIKNLLWEPYLEQTWSYKDSLPVDFWQQESSKVLLGMRS